MEHFDAKSWTYPCRTGMSRVLWELRHRTTETTKAFDPRTVIDGNVVIVGDVGTGKTLALRMLTDEARAQKIPGIKYTKVQDIKREIRPGKDVYLHPADPGTHAWAILRDIGQGIDATKVASAIFGSWQDWTYLPLKPQDKKFWDKRAAIEDQRAAVVFADTLRALAARGDMTNRALHDACNVMPLGEYHKLLEGTQAAGLMDPKEETTARAIRATMTAVIEALPMLRDDTPENTVSIRDYIRSLGDGNDAWLFLSASHARGQQPMNELWLDIAAASILHTPEGKHRPKLVLCVDELQRTVPLYSLRVMMRGSEAYDVSVWTAVQSLNVLKEHYSDSAIQALVAAPQHLLVLAMSEPTSAELISNALDERDKCNRFGGWDIMRFGRRSGVLSTRGGCVQRVALPLPEAPQ